MAIIMATNFNSLFLLQLLILLHSSLVLPLLANTSTHVSHTIHLNSFLQRGSTCKPYKSSTKTPSTLDLYHRYGPCSPLNRGRTAPPLSEILSRDQSRVRSIQARAARNSNSSNFNDLKANLPTKSGLPLGTGNYIVTVGLGTPAKSLSLAFDTGSDLTWTQCEPCSGSCYPQKETIFDPTSSSSYSNVSCNTPECSQASVAAGQSSVCAGTTCTYATQYGDGSSSQGFISKDTITLTTDIFPNFIFGCGQDTSEGFGTTAGILGLGRDPTSIILQTAQKYDKYFSYCIPSSQSSTGHLTLGKTGSSTGNIAFTPFARPSNTSFYYVEIVGISVGGNQLSINPTIFTSAGTVIDSGTVITRLPPTAYNALKQAFQKGMSNYTRAAGSRLLDTCYDFSNLTSVEIPKVAFTFASNVVVDIKPEGILFVRSMQQVCLAFAGNGDDSDLGIFGNTQQKTYEVVYDVAGGNLGFGEGGC